MEKPKFYPPPVKFTPTKFSTSNSAHVITSRTSTPVPNFIAISLQGAFPKICKILRFCDFFCCPVLSWLYFFLETPPRSNPGRILTVYALAVPEFFFGGGARSLPPFPFLSLSPPLSSLPSLSLFLSPLPLSFPLLPQK